MTIAISWNHRPESVAVILDADGEQTVPSGKYHRVEYSIFDGGELDINSVTAHTTTIVDNGYQAGSDTTTGVKFTALAGKKYNATVNVYSAGTLPSIEWNSNAAIATTMVLGTTYTLSGTDRINKTSATSTNVSIQILGEDDSKSGYFWADETETYQISGNGYLIVEEYAAS